MYGKLENGNLIVAPKVVTIGNKIISNPTEEQIKSLGYKSVFYEEKPTEEVEGKMYVSSFEDKGLYIQQVWVLEETSPTQEERIEALEEALDMILNGVTE